jgi:DnaJ-class molecular chaperone
MRGLGMPLYEQPDSFGDLYVEIIVDIPTQLTDAARALYEQLATLKA